MAQNAYPIIKAADVGSVVLSPSAQGTSAYSWMDAYLAAFAIAGGHQLITTDKGFKQFAELNPVILSRA